LAARALAKRTQIDDFCFAVSDLRENYAAARRLGPPMTAPSRPWSRGP